MNKTEVRRMMTKGFVCARVRAGFNVITRKDITSDYSSHLTFLGVSTRGLGFETTKVMKRIGRKVGYVFRYDGKSKDGRYLNPRLVKKGHKES